MQGKLRNMASVYITDGNRMLLLYRVGSRVVAPSWCGVGGHFEKEELNDAKAAILREVWEEIGLRECDLKNLKLRYITLRNKNGEIRQNYYFFAELAKGTRIEKKCNVIRGYLSLKVVSYLRSGIDKIKKEIVY